MTRANRCWVFVEHPHWGNFEQILKLRDLTVPERRTSCMAKIPLNGPMWSGDHKGKLMVRVGPMAE